MIKSIRKTLALVLSILMLVSAMPMVSLAATVSQSGFTYDANDGEAILTKYAGTGKTVTVPSTVSRYGSTYTVVKIGKKTSWNTQNPFAGNTNITSVTLPDTVDEILEGTFSGCTKLATVDLGGVTAIPASTFKNCRALKTVTIGADLESIAANAFDGTDVTTINFEGTEEEWAELISAYEGDDLDGASVNCYVNWSCVDDGCVLVEVAYVAPSCTQTGNIAYSYCKVCKAKITADGDAVEDDDIVIPVADHDEVPHEAKSATCTDFGWNEYVTCSRCNYTTYQEIPALNHDEVSHEAKTPTCTEGGWEEYVTCSRCDYTTYEALPENGHREVKDGEDTEATCTKVGFKQTVICGDCGITIEDGYLIDKLGHEMVKDVVRSSESTCVTNGVLYMVCSRENCDYEEITRDLPLIEHSYVEWTTTTNPTCVNQGIELSNCEVCGLPKTEFVDALGHNYDFEAAVDNENGTHTAECTVCDADTFEHTKTFNCDYNAVVTNPTCTQAGYTTYTCKICEYTYNDDATTAKGHTFGDWASNNDGTHSRACTVCANEANRIETVDCSYGDWTVTTDPECEEEGVKAHICTVCEYVETAAVEALGHKDEDKDHECDNAGCTVVQGTHADGNSNHICDYGCEERIGTCEDVTTVDHLCDYGCGATFGTCSDSATDDDHVCDYGCGAVLERCADGEDKNHTCDICGAADITEHTWVDADCVTPKTCSHCDATEGEALGHDEVPHEAKAPTCTAIGWDAYVTCAVEGCNYTTYAEKAALEHNIISVEAQDPTCTEVGWDDYEYCDREGCDYTTYDEIDALGHTEAVLPGTAATCTKAGEEDGVYCEVCDTVLVEKAVIAALGHDFVVDEENSKKVTCEEDGVTAEDCSRCDEKRVTNHKALGHSIENWVTSEYPTCEKEGLEIGRCVNCRKYTETNKLAKIACIDENGDKKCDMCKKTIEDKPADAPTETPEDKPENNCSCYCHKTGILRFFLFDIPLLFLRFLGLNKECKCGAVHY